MNKLSNEALEQNNQQNEEESHETEDEEEEIEEAEEDNNDNDRDESEIVILNNLNEFQFEIPDSIENDPKKLIDILKSELVMAKSESHSFEQKYLQVKFELKDTQSQLKHVQSDKDDLLKELNNLIASKLKLQNEIKRYKSDYEAIHKEYTQVMSERDLVHKEIEALQEQLCKEKDKIKYLTSNCTEIDVLKRELSTAITDRDLALNELKAIYEKKFESFIKSDRNSTVYNSNSSLIYEKYFVSKDEKLAQENAKLRQDMKDLQQEIEIANKRRDWAFNERDKMMRERESIRALCDELRYQRDKSISELAEALRESDEQKKLRANAMRQISLLEETIHELEDKLIAKKEMNDWRMLNVEVTIEDESADFGVQFKTEVPVDDYDQDLYSPQYLIVDHVSKKSPAYGRLKKSDHVFRINDTDIKDIDLKLVQDLINSLKGNVRFIVSREYGNQSVEQDRQNQSQVSVSEQLISVHKNTMSDLMIETGVYVSALKPNSEANDCLDIGDRIISVNGYKLANKSYNEIVTLIKDQPNDFNLIVLKKTPGYLTRNSSPFTTRNSTSSSSFLLNDSLIKNIQSNDSLRLTPKNWIRDSLASKLNKSFSQQNNEETPSYKKSTSTWPKSKRKYNGAKTISTCRSSRSSIQNKEPISCDELKLPVVNRKKPFVGEIRIINIEKQHKEVLGINISEKEKHPGIYVCQVIKDSLADRAGIHEGDQILEICGVNLRTAGYKEAAKVLMDCSSNDFVSLVLQYNPKQLSNSKLNTLSLKTKICLIKKLNIEILGGNETGIFVNKLKNDSCLQVGDQILEVNDISLRHVTYERAFYELFLNEINQDQARLIIQNNYISYEKLNLHEVDSFFVVCLFDRKAKTDKELRLNKNDILHVINTLPNGKIHDYWTVRVIHSQTNSDFLPRIGLVPSFKKIFDEIRNSRSPHSRSNSSLGSQSHKNGNFFTNFLKQASSKSLESTQTIMDYQVDLASQQDAYFDPYELIECLDTNIKRPCVIIGPLNLFICRQIEITYPEGFHFFERDLVHYTKLTENLIDIIPRQSTSQYDCIDLLRLQEIANNKHQHAFLKLENLNEIESLKRTRLYPIVIILNYKSPKHLIHLNSLCSPTSNNSTKLDVKVAKDLIKYTSDIEKKFKHYVNISIEIASNDIKTMCESIKEHILYEQSKKLWIPAWSPQYSKDILLTS